MHLWTIFFCSLWITTSFATASGKHRARDCGLNFPGRPGKLNALTDVDGVEIGMKTIIKDIKSTDNNIKTVRTGVTIIFPRGKKSDAPVPAAYFSMNGNGELTGAHWIDESGFLEGPIGLTNTHSVGVVRDAIVAWGQKKFKNTETYSLPVVAETWDGYLNDINGFHITREDVIEAIEDAKPKVNREGNVGGGTGMILCEHKGGTGSASRITDSGFKIGVLVQANYGNIEDLNILGVQVGQKLGLPRYKNKKKDGSIIVVIGTDAPLLPHQLKRLAKRAALGVARAGGIARNSSGDLFVAFSTKAPKTKKGLLTWESVRNDQLDALFESVVFATEEAIINVYFAAETMTGNDLTIPQLPIQQVLEFLNQHGGKTLRCL